MDADRRDTDGRNADRTHTDAEMDMPDSPRVPGNSVDSLVQHATDNQVCRITLNRPETLNAITPDQRERIIELLTDASADPGVRAVVILAEVLAVGEPRLQVGRSFGVVRDEGALEAVLDVGGRDGGPVLPRAGVPRCPRRPTR